MSISTTALYTAFKTWIDTATGFSNTIRAEVNGPKPTSPHFTMRLNNFSPIGDDWVGNVDNNGDAEIVGNRDFVLEVQGYKKGVVDKIEDIEQALNKLSVIQAFRNAGIVIVDSMPSVNITGLDDTKYEERISKDFLLGR